MYYQCVDVLRLLYLFFILLLLCLLLYTSLLVCQSFEIPFEIVTICSFLVIVALVVVLLLVVVVVTVVGVLILTSRELRECS